MTTGETILLVVSAIIFLLAARAFLPRSIFFFVPWGISSTYQSGTERPEGLREETVELLTQLGQLGYKQDGILTEKSPLWGKSANNIIMTASGSSDYAAVVEGRKNSFYYFQSIFSDGRIAVTAESGFRNMSSEHLCQHIVDLENVAEIQQAHRGYVAEFSKAGSPPYHHYTPEILEQSTRIYYGLPESQRSMRRFGLSSLVILVVLSAPLIIAIINVVS